jgi:hypothetical protein
MKNPGAAKQRKKDLGKHLAGVRTSQRPAPIAEILLLAARCFVLSFLVLIIFPLVRFCRTI